MGRSTVNDSRAQKVLALLSSRGPLAPWQIADALGVDGVKLRNTLSGLFSTGKIERAGRVPRPPAGIMGGPKRTSLWRIVGAS